MDVKKARNILGIEGKIDQTAVKRKLRELAKKYHPDINNSREAHEKMQEINRAYAVIMKEEFNVLDPWKDYNKWWLKQFGNDPLWGNPSSEEYYGKNKKFPGVAKSNNQIENKKKNPQQEIIDKFLNVTNTYAVIGVSKDPKKYGNKIFYDLKIAGYHVYPVNPRINNIEGEKCYPSTSALPSVPDVIDIVVPPKIAEKVVEDAIKQGVKKVWFQPGSESERAIKYCEENNVDVLHSMCIMVEQNKRKKAIKEKIQEKVI